jgi:hypothetical protein
MVDVVSRKGDQIHITTEPEGEGRPHPDEIHRWYDAMRRRRADADSARVRQIIFEMDRARVDRGHLSRAIGIDFRGSGLTAENDEAGHGSRDDIPQRRAEGGRMRSRARSKLVTNRGPQDLPAFNRAK